MNLGGDATLVAPSARHAEDKTAYVHLASFVRKVKQPPFLVQKQANLGFEHCNDSAVYVKF